MFLFLLCRYKSVFSISYPKVIIFDNYFPAILNSHTDGKGIITEFDYDNNSNLTSINYAASLTTSFTYDAMNNRKTQVLPAYGTLTYGYDVLNRLTSQSDSTGTLNWTLDGNGNATQTNYTFSPAHSLGNSGLSAAVESAKYNNQDLRTQFTDIAGLTTLWRYNKNDLTEEITYPSLGTSSGDFTRYTYDRRNRTRSAIMKGGSVSYEYFNDGLLKKATYANGAESKYSYTPRNQVESIKHSINNALLSELAYTYDKNDNRKTETKNNGTGEVVTSYDFDDNDRIESIDYPAQYNELAKTVAYQFDAANNRTLETIIQNSKTHTKTYAYNNLDQLTNISSTDAEKTQVKYDYDANGNLEQKRSSKTLNNITQTETNDYAFDIRGQLKSVTMGGSSIGQFLYDDAGQRLRTQYNDLDNGQPTTQTHAQHSLYQGLKLISQYDVSDSNSLILNANYQFASSNSGVMNIGRRAFNETDLENNTQTFYHTDSLGSVLATSKFDHSIAARYDYDVWGNELNNTDTSDNPLGFTGHQMDRASENKTGLIYANARYLDPDTGRFLSFDPFEGYDEKPISLHRYMYAYQNPVRYIDPDGRMGMAPGPCNWRPCNTTDQRQQATEQYQASNKAAVEGIANFAADGIVDDYRSSQSASDFLSKRGDRIKDDFKDGVIAGVAATACGAAKVCKAVKNTAESAYENGAKKLSEFSDKAKSKLKTTKESDISPNSATCPCCFAGGTPVLTESGFKSIELVEKGELVASRNEETGEVEWKPVTALFVNDDDRLTYSLILIDERGNEESYEVTDNHPFNVEGLGWVDAIDLKAGMQIPSYSGGYLIVVSIKSLNQSPITYNFEVDEFHTYFVGEQGAWVHNSCNCKVDYPVKPGDRGSYSDLKSHKRKYGQTEPVEMHEMPSYAAKKEAFKEKYGRYPSTPEEKRIVRDQGISEAVKPEVHAETDTYKWKNKKKKYEDSKDLEAAQARDEENLKEIKNKLGDEYEG